MISCRHAMGKTVGQLFAVFAMFTLVAGLVGPTLVSAEPVTFVKDAPLRSEARFDSAPVAQVAKGTAGDASTKQGAWLNIKTPGGTGWALTTDISFGSGASSGGGGGGTSLGSIFGRSQPTRTTSTVGIRGFDKETIGNAFGDSAAISTAQLSLLDSYAVDKAGGQSFASAQGLSATAIQY